MGTNLLNNYIEVTAVIVFGVGFTMLYLCRNLIKKAIGFNFMDCGIFLFLASKGYIVGKVSPIVVDGITSTENYINPIPAGLVLTGIVVSVSVTAFFLALTIRLYMRYGTLDLDEIMLLARAEDE